MIFRESVLDLLRWMPKGEVGRGLTRFLSVFPYLENPVVVADAFKDILDPVRDDLPWTVKPLFWMAENSPRLLSPVLTFGNNIFSGRFVAGNDIPAIVRAARRYRRQGFLVNIDILGETVLSEKSARKYLHDYFVLILHLSSEFRGKELSVSVKPSACYSQQSPSAPEYAAEVIAERLAPICGLLKYFGGHVYLDAEEYASQGLYWILFKNLYRHYGSTARYVLQAYLRNSEEVLDDISSLQDGQDPIWVRLVRGAYWDHEKNLAQKNGWAEPPVFTRKVETDAQYHRLLEKGFRNGLVMIPGTHNADSIYYAESLARRLGVIIPEFQLILGMGEPFARILMKKNIPVRFYMPGLSHGNPSEAIGYLMRRIVDNRSQFSFLAEHSGPKLEEALNLLRSLKPRERR